MMEKSRGMGLPMEKLRYEHGKRRPAQRGRGARLLALGCGLLIWATAAVALAAAESSSEPPPLLLFRVHDGCTRSPKLEQALTAHLNRMGEHLVGCPALEQALPELAPCSGAACATQLPSECKQSPVRLLGAELHQAGSLMRLRLWLTEASAGPSAEKLRVVQDACVNCDTKHVQELLISRAGELLEGRESIGGMCSPQAAAEAGDAGAPEPQITLLVVDLAEKERAVRAAIESYLTRLGHQIVVARRRTAKSCASQECLAALAHSYKGYGVTQILTIASGPQPGIPQVFVYDTQSRRAEQRDIQCESCDEPQLLTALAEAAGQLAVRCLREHCPPPPRAQASARPAGACAPLPEPQCGGPALVVKPEPSSGKPALARRIGAGALIGAGAAIIAGSLIWSLASRTSLNESFAASSACNFMNQGALSGSCQIINHGGVDIAGYFVGAAAITGGVLLLKLPLERRVLVASSAERK